MASPNLQHRRAHNLLLVSKLLNQKDVASPFTLILDSIEQSAKPLVDECLQRAAKSNVIVIFVSFETIRKPTNTHHFIRAGLNPQAWQHEVLEAMRSNPTHKKLLVFDSLNLLCSEDSARIPALLSSFIGPGANLLAVYHADIPAPQNWDAYATAPLTMLKYLATSLFTVHSIHHVLARKAARDRSQVEPTFGLEEGTEGTIQGLGANSLQGIVLELEHRRKSGRGVREQYFLPSRRHLDDVTTVLRATALKETVTLLEDHPEYRHKDEGPDADVGGPESISTFEIGLTDRQRRDREGVVLPYFDAQKGDGEGGRILYDMGSEDDFDDEEDEI